MQPTPTLKQDSSSLWIVIVIAVLVAGGLCWWLWPRTEPVAPTEVVAPAEAEGAAAAPSTSAQPTSPDPAVIDDDRWAATIAELPELPWPPEAEAAAEARQAMLEELQRIDPQAAGDLYARLSDAAVELASRPPVPGEMRDPMALLDNVLHLGRVLGKRRTLELKALLGGAKVDTESLAAAGYTWLLTRQAAEDRREQTITLGRLYAYSSWLLESVGGRALLARRLPRHEALAEFYALMTVDLAERHKLGSWGTDPRPHIARCRRLVETQGLAHRQAYLAALDRLESRW